MLVSRSAMHVQRGFTLLEAMIAISILVILAGVAAANFSSIVNSSRLRAAMLDFTTDLAQARSEAIKLNRDVTLASSGADWTSGWVISASAGAVTLKSREALPTGLSSSSTATSFVFTGSGRPGATGTVTFCPAANSGAKGRRVSIDTVGQPRSEVLSSCP